jgi:hypothetical protein
MSPFAIKQNSSVDEVQIFLSTFEGGTSTLISPLKWNQSMNPNMKSTFYNYLRDYIYCKVVFDVNDTEAVVAISRTRRSDAKTTLDNYNKTSKSKQLSLLHYCNLLNDDVRH